MPASGILHGDEDAFGRLLLDQLDGRARDPVLEREDGQAGPALPGAWFFAEPDDWAPPEREAFALVRGRVLDIGAGAGRHALEAQRRGLDAVAIDISPGAVEVCRRRGVRDARLLALADVDERLGSFDTVLLMCGNVGLGGGAAETAAMLRRLHELTGAGRIVVDSVDPHVENDEADLAYLEQNRRRGRMPGHVTIRLLYGAAATPWFDLLCLSAAELERLAAQAGWRILWSRPGEPPDHYAVLAKA